MESSTMYALTREDEKKLGFLRVANARKTGDARISGNHVSLTPYAHLPYEASSNAGQREGKKGRKPRNQNTRGGAESRKESAAAEQKGEKRDVSATPLSSNSSQDASASTLYSVDAEGIASYLQESTGSIESYAQGIDAYEASEDGDLTSFTYGDFTSASIPVQPPLSSGKSSTQHSRQKKKEADMTSYLHPHASRGGEGMLIGGALDDSQYRPGTGSTTPDFGSPEFGSPKEMNATGMSSATAAYLADESYGLPNSNSHVENHAAAAYIENPTTELPYVSYAGDGSEVMDQGTHDMVVAALLQRHQQQVQRCSSGVDDDAKIHQGIPSPVGTRAQDAEALSPRDTTDVDAVAREDQARKPSDLLRSSGSLVSSSLSFESNQSTSRDIPDDSVSVMSKNSHGRDSLRGSVGNQTLSSPRNGQISDRGSSRNSLPWPPSPEAMAAVMSQQSSVSDSSSPPPQSGSDASHVSLPSPSDRQHCHLSSGQTGHETSSRRRRQPHQPGEGGDRERRRVSRETPHRAPGGNSGDAPAEFRASSMKASQAGLRSSGHLPAHKFRYSMMGMEGSRSETEDTSVSYADVLEGRRGGRESKTRVSVRSGGGGGGGGTSGRRHHHRQRHDEVATLHQRQDDKDAVNEGSEDSDDEDDAELHTTSYTFRICQVGQAVCTIILQLCREADQGSNVLSQENRARLTFLKETVDLMMSYVSRQISDVKKHPRYNTILRRLIEHFEQTLHMMKQIAAKEACITQNFDIFELTLRRYLEQLRKMFPLQPSSRALALLIHPADLIEDRKARNAWVRLFGRDRHYVNFATFVDRLLKGELMKSYAREINSVKQEKLVQFLHYFINFPDDDLVTTYKWNALIRLFGPYESFLDNFLRIAVSRHGFLGLVNRIKAFELLRMKRKTRIVLIRFSRTAPDYLAFSFKNSNGQIGHQINRRENGDIIPVDRYLKDHFPGYTLVEEMADIAKVLELEQKASLCQYAAATYGYIVAEVP